MNLFLSRMKSLLKDEYEDFLKYYEGENFKGLRVNTLKCTPSRLEELIDFDISPTPFCDCGYYINEKVVALGNSPLHLCGAFYMQEPSATSAVTMLGVEKGDRVLDLCAAPGGKSTQIASVLNSTGLLWSNEIVRGRANILLSNIERMGVKNAVVSSCSPEVLCEKLSGCFDKILVDAPCSGEGMFRKNSMASAEWSVEHVKSCAKRQLKILNSAKKALKDGGVMVYSTCTFSQEENEGVIESFLSQNSDFELEDAGVCFGRPALGYARRIFPMDGGEGHFAARLRKKGVSSKAFAPLRRTHNSDKQRIKEAFALYDELFSDRPFGDRLEVIGNRAVILPEEYDFNESGINIIRAGVVLGEFLKNRIEPHHSVFAAVSTRACKSCVDFDRNDEAVKKFLHGEELEVPADIRGYTAVCVNSMTLGFGKASGGRLKNKYPKGLRILR